MKFSVFAIAALAAATSTSSRYMVAATAASRNRKIQKKTSSSSGVPHSSEYGATESSGQPPRANCKNTSDCAIPSGLDHAVCRDGQCQSGASGSSCGVTSDCVVPPGLDHPVCRDGTCQDGTPGASCGVTSDCVVPQGLDHAVCGQGKCLTSPIPIGGNCYAVHNDWHNGCVIPPGLTQSVCLLNTCQSGQPGSPCRHTSDCVVQDNLDPPHAVCRGRQRSHCQRCVQCTI